MVFLFFATQLQPISEIEPVAHTEPSKSNCLPAQPKIAFNGVELCQNDTILCAAVSSIFTWYAHDSSVDAGYDRARKLIYPTGWKDVDTHQDERPSTYDDISTQPPLHMITIWQQIHALHHNAIAYVLFDPEKGPFSVTQFEYQENQVNTAGIPIAGAIPLQTRQWVVVPLTRYDENDSFFKLDMLFALNNYQGIPIDEITSKHPQNMQYPTVPFPRTQQSIARRWQCQGVFRA